MVIHCIIFFNLMSSIIFSIDLDILVAQILQSVSLRSNSGVSLILKQKVFSNQALGIRICPGISHFLKGHRKLCPVLGLRK